MYNMLVWCFFTQHHECSECCECYKAMKLLSLATSCLLGWVIHDGELVCFSIITANNLRIRWSISKSVKSVWTEIEIIEHAITWIQNQSFQSDTNYSLSLLISKWTRHYINRYKWLFVLNSRKHSTTFVQTGKFDFKEAIKLFRFMKENYSGVLDISDIMHVKIRANHNVWWNWSIVT